MADVDPQALPDLGENVNAVHPPTPERQIIHELCLLLGLVHHWGSEDGAVGHSPLWLQRRYAWAVQQAHDSGGVADQ